MPTLPVAIDARKALVGAGQFTAASKMITGGSANIGRSLKMMALGLAAMGVAAGAAALKLVKVASNAEETQAKFDTVFRKQAKATNQWANSFARDVGRAEQDVKDWSATLQDTLVPLGFAREEATKLTKTLVGLGVDVASFSNRADADVLNNFSSAIVGVHQAVRSYGIVLNEQSIQDEAYRQGINKQFKDLTNLEKVQLRIGVILRSTTDAQGDAVRTGNSYANQLKRLGANVKNIAEDVGNILLPAFSSALQGINAWLQSNRYSFTYWGKRAKLEVESAIGYFGVMKTFLTDDFSGAMGVAWDVFLEAIRLGAVAAIALAQTVGKAIFEGLKTGLFESMSGGRSESSLLAEAAKRYKAQGGKEIWGPAPRGGVKYGNWKGTAPEGVTSTMVKDYPGDLELLEKIKTEIKAEDSAKKHERLAQGVTDAYEQQVYVLKSATEAFKENVRAKVEESNPLFAAGLETQSELRKANILTLEGERVAMEEAAKAAEELRKKNAALLEASLAKNDAAGRTQADYAKEDSRALLRQQIAEVRAESRYLAENSDRRERAIALRAFEKEATEGLTDAKRVAYDADIQALQTKEEFMEAMDAEYKILQRQEKAYNAGVEAGNAFGNTLMGIAEHARNTGDALDALRLLMVDVIKIAIKYAFIQPLGEALGGALSAKFGPKAAGLTTAPGMTDLQVQPATSGSTVLSAKGNVFTNGSLSYFAKGGLTNGVTAFALGGGVGIAGEKGQEGIFPLGRNSKGELGVKSTGGGQQQPIIVQYQPPQIIIENSTGQAMEQGPTTDDGSGFIVRIVAKDMGSGGPTYKAWQQRQAMSRR